MPNDQADRIPCRRVWRNARLATMAGPGLGAVEDAALAIDGERIVFAGPEADLPAGMLDGAEIIDAEGRWITPGLIDCHTHLVYAGDRAKEFELRLGGAGNITPASLPPELYSQYRETLLTIASSSLPSSASGSSLTFPFSRSPKQTATCTTPCRNTLPGPLPP